MKNSDYFNYDKKLDVNKYIYEFQQIILIEQIQKYKKSNMSRFIDNKRIARNVFDGNCVYWN